MKITWDNIDTFNITKNGNFKRGSTYWLLKKCIYCGDSYFADKKRYKQGKSLYCDNKCQNKHKPPHNTPHTEKTRLLISMNRKGKCCGDKNPFYGRKHTDDTILKISTKNKGRKHTDDTILKMSGNRSVVWKGGYATNKIPTYDTYHKQLEPYVSCYRNIVDNNILDVSCYKCGRRFTPKIYEVVNKIRVLKFPEKYNGSNNIYCSDKCKTNCRSYGKRVESLMIEDNPSLTHRREVQPQLRKLVFERDDYICQLCDQQGGVLNCHHFEGIEINPIESADIDNCITVCKNCHNNIHQLDGCKYSDYKRKECIGE